MDTAFKLLFIKPHAKTPGQCIDIPIGILSLSSYLKKYLQNSIEIKFTDLRVEKRKNIKDIIKLFQPDLIGISLLSFEKKALSTIIPIIHNHIHSAKIIVGGPYATTNFNELLQNHQIECAVIGEGERVLLNIVKHYIASKAIHDIKGIAFHNGRSVVCNNKEDYIQDLDDIPFPDYTLIDIKKYWGYHQQHNTILAKKQYAPVMSSRACPYNCIYCHNIFGKKLRKKSPQHFFNEIKLLYEKYHVREFHIVDDTFNVDRQHMSNILTMIIESDINIKIAFPNAVRGDLLNENDMNLLKKAGTYMITFAIESASEKIQQFIKKNLDVQKTVENINYANSIGLLTKGYFMLGFPTETVDEMKETIKLAISSRLDMAAFFIVAPFEGTKLYEIIKTTVNNIDAIQCNTTYLSKHSFYEQFSGYNINRLRNIAYIKFYSLKRLVKLFLKIPKKTYFIFRFIALTKDYLRT